jgi:LPS-assembly protein
MTTRIRLLITAVLVCHLLLAPRVVTSQLLPTRRPAKSPSPQHSNQSPLPVTIRAAHQEKDGAVYKLNGDVQIDYGTYTIKGDDATYNSDTGDIFAEGHLLLEGGPNDEHVEATRGTYNIQKETGRFEHVTGSIGLKVHHTGILTGSNPFFFTGRIVEKAGPDHYIVTDGAVTTCELPRPKWQFFSHKVNVEVGGNATI